MLLSFVAVQTSLVQRWNLWCLMFLSLWFSDDEF